MFSDVVALYRALKRPTVKDDGTFEFDGYVDAETLRLLETCKALPSRFGEFDDHHTAADGKLHLSGAMPRGDVGQFYNTFSSFFNGAQSIAFGTLPTTFYVADLDYFSDDADKPEAIQETEKLTEFVRLLSDFAEDRNAFGSAVNRLLFVLPSDGRAAQRTVVMEVRPEEAALHNSLTHLRLLQELVDDKNTRKLHIEERRLVMRSAIGEVLSNAGSGVNLLTHLAQKWSDVLQKYRHNFQSYINNFAFDEVRKKIADSEIEHASKMSGVFGDIAGKLLALPISLVALIALDDAKTASAFFIGCVGLTIVSVVYFFILRNLGLQSGRLKSSFDLTFSPFFDKFDTYPGPLRKVLEQRRSALAQQMRFLRITFSVFYVLAAVPMSGALWKIWMRYSSQLAALGNGVLTCAAKLGGQFLAACGRLIVYFDQYRFGATVFTLVVALVSLAVIIACRTIVVSRGAQHKRRNK